VKFNLKERRFDTISHIQDNVTIGLKSIPTAELYRSIQKLYDCANRRIELGEMYVEGSRVIKFFSKNLYFLWI
jgi:hypothetical protein